MAKHKIACAVTAAAIIMGSGLFTPIRSWAETAIDPASASETAGTESAGAEDVVGAYVATDGEKSYATLEEAIATVNGVAHETPVTITLLSDTKAGGFKIQKGSNFVLDLGGHTLYMGDITTGSSGTETLNWQLLKGSTIEMKNGTMIGSDVPTSKLLIMNYADLTLRDITIDGTKLQDASQGKYVLSNVHGTVNIIGNTNIIAAEDGHAFDVDYKAGSSYGDGARVTVDTTGEIRGKIAVAESGSPEASAINSSLTIKNGNFTRDISVTTKMSDKVKIQGGTFGGTFNSDPSAYLDGENADAYVSYVAAGSTEDAATYGLAKITDFGVVGNDTIELKAGDYVDLSEMPYGPANYDGWKYTESALSGVLTGSGLQAPKLVAEDMNFTVTIAAYNVTGKVIASKDVDVIVKSGSKQLAVGRFLGDSTAAGSVQIDFTNVLDGDNLTLKVKKQEISEDLLKQEPNLKDFYDISVVDGEDKKVEVKNNEMTVKVAYRMDKVYKHFQIAYINEEGKIAEFIDVNDEDVICRGAEDTETGEETHLCDITFNTNHLSGYGAAGSDEEFEDAEIRNKALSTPDSGAAMNTDSTSSLDTTTLVATVIVMTLATAGMEFALWKKRRNSKN